MMLALLVVAAAVVAVNSSSVWDDDGSAVAAAVVVGLSSAWLCHRRIENCGRKGLGMMIRATKLSLWSMERMM